MKIKRWQWSCAAGAAALVGASVAPAFGLGSPLVFHQTGNSMPKGWYIYQHGAPAAKGEVIVLKDPPHFELRWLMKRVEAVRGDAFCWEPNRRTHTINGRPMPPPHPGAIALGIKVWEGCRTLGEGEVVGYGISGDSYDSRYLGPVPEQNLWGVYARVSS